MFTFIYMSVVHTDGKLKELDPIRNMFALVMAESLGQEPRAGQPRFTWTGSIPCHLFHTGN